MRLPTFLVFLIALTPGALIAAEPVDYAKHIRPLLEKHCVSCHGAGKQKAGLKLDLGKRVLKGSLNGPVVLAKKSAESKLIHALKGEKGAEPMPPTGPLEAAEIALIARWIDDGAAIPPDEKDTAVAHWAFEPPVRAPVPQGVHPVDHLLQTEWAKRGLKPASAADRDTLVRRLHLDLTGLPPTPEDIATFRNDTTPDAYSKRVSALLASPQYGERWGRHLLDIWRYSDWYGYGAELRNSQKHIWNWRDWTVESLNAGKPYGAMIREMLAGDEIAPTDPKVLRATGYLARSYYKFNRNVWLDDIVEHTGKAFLGITLNCARCHDHMYDPIAQEEYYRVRAIFEPHQLRMDAVPGERDLEKRGLPRVYDADAKIATYLFERGDDKRPVKDKPLSPGVPAAFGPKGFALVEVKFNPEAAHPTLRTEVSKDLLDQAAKRVAVAQEKKSEPRLRAAIVNVQAVKAKIAADRARYAVPKNPQAADVIRHAVALHLEAALLDAEADLIEAQDALSTKDTEPQKAAKIATMIAANAKVDAARSAVKKPAADYPALLPALPEQSTGRRTALANWIASKQNPLTARVFVNHIWMRHFGQPLVPTVFDFGKNGRPPSHPKLLDWLAVEFMESNWDIKKLHRMILTSRAYQMRSTMAGADANANRKLDPDNLLVWKMNPRPLEAEAIRDSLLSVSGLLDPQLGGPELDSNDEAPKMRRSLYYRHAPEKVMPFLMAFDAAGPTECYRRATTVVPQQAMALVNSRLSARAAEAVAKELPAKESSETVRALYEKLLGRAPSDPEAKLCLEFLKANTAAALAQVLFNHADFSTIR